MIPRSVCSADFTLQPSGGSWSSDATWGGGPVPGASEADIVRVNSVGGQTIVLVVDDDFNSTATQPWTIGTLQVAAPAPISAGLGTLKLSPPPIDSAVSFPRTLSLKSVNAGAGSTVVFDEGLDVIANSLVINGDGSQGRVEIAGLLANLDDGSPGSVEVKGGTVVFKLSPSYTGATTLNGGKIILAGDEVLFGLDEGLTLTAGTLTADSSDRDVSDIVSVRGPVQLGEVGSGTLSLKREVNLAGGRRVLNVVGDVVVSGAVTNGGTSSGILVKGGAGTLELKSLGTYTGGTELLEGRLIASVENALGGGTDANTNFLPGGTLTVGGGVLELGANQNVTGIRIGGGSVVASAGVNPSLVVHGSEIVAEVQSKARVEVVLTEANGSTVSLTKTGPGVLELAGSNFYSGNTTIEGGEIRVFAGAQPGGGSPLGKAAGGGDVILDGGSLRISRESLQTDLGKNLTVVSSGVLVAEGGGVKLDRILVNANATFKSTGLVTASSIDVDGRFVLSGNNAIRAGSLRAGPGAVFVWDKPNVGKSNVGIQLITNAETDLSKAKIEFSKEFLERALIETKGLLTAGGASAGQNTFQVGSLAVSGGTLKAPSVVQPGGEMRFSLDTSDSTRIGIVLERSAYEELATGIKGVANMFNYVSLQTLAVVNTVDMHLDDVNAGGAASSYVSMGVQVNATPAAASLLSPVWGGADSRDHSMRVWTSGYGSWARIEADPATFQGKVNSAAGGGVLGLERSFGNLTAGLVVSVGQSVSRAEDPQLRLESENWNLGGYSTVQIGPVNVDISALWGVSEQDSKREVPTGDIVTARYSARNWQTGLGLAMNLASPESTWQLAPVARLKFLNTSQDAFEESGSALGIGSDARNQSHWLTKLGLRASKSLSLTQSIPISLDGAAYWVHDYNSEGREVQFQLGGAPYVVRSRDRKADSTQFNLGLQATFFDSVTLRLSGQQDVAQDRSQTSGVFSLAYKF